MANLYRSFQDITARLIVGIAEHGMPDGIDESFPSLVAERLRDLAASAVYNPGQGVDAFLDAIEVREEYRIIEETSCPEVEEMPKVVASFNRLHKRIGVIETLARTMEDIETGDPQRECMAYERLADIKPSEERINPDAVVLLPDEIDRAEKLIPDRSGHPATGTVFDSWCRLGPGELGVILGQPNVGKSAGLVDIGGGYAENNEGLVFHFSEEMSLGSCLGRYDRRICRGAKGRSKLRVWDGIPGNIVVEAHPTKTSTVGFLEERVARVCDSLGLSPIAIVVDSAYMLVASRDYGSSYDEQNEVVLALRRMAGRLNTQVWTGVQPQRGPARETRQARMTDILQHTLPVLDIHDVAGCWAIPQVADYVISLNQTTEERNMSPPIARLARCKVREVDDKLAAVDPIIEVQIDYGTSTFI